MATTDCLDPGGYGPWFCALLFNTSKTCKKQTHIVAHTLPHLAVDYLNYANRNKKSEDCWVIIQKVGPFENWAYCVAYLNLWTLKTRGRQRRLERGIEIFNHYRQSLNLTLWVQTKTREEMIQSTASLVKKRRLLPSLINEDEQQGKEEQKGGVEIKTKKATKKKESANKPVTLDELEKIFGETTATNTLCVNTIDRVRARSLFKK